MAKIRLGGIAQDIRGSQNGLTFSRNKGGAYVRQRVAPTNVASPARTRQRNIFAAAAKGWSGTINDTQRAAWTSFALVNPVTDIFGASVILSGMAMYVRLNSVLATVGAAAITDPPLSLVVTPNALATGCTFNGGGPSVAFQTAAQATNANTKYYVFGTDQNSVGRSPGRSAYRYIGAYASVAAAIFTNINTEWLAKYTNIVTGAKYGLLIAQVDITSGAVLAGQTFTAIAT